MLVIESLGITGQKRKGGFGAASNPQFSRITMNPPNHNNRGANNKATPRLHTMCNHLENAINHRFDFEEKGYLCLAN